MAIESKAILYAAEARVFHRSIVNYQNGYEAIEPCYTGCDRGPCPNLDKTGKQLCKVEQNIEYGRDGLECPLQHGKLTVIYKRS